MLSGPATAALFRHGAVGSLAVLGFLLFQSLFALLGAELGRAGLQSALLERGLYALVFGAMAYAWFAWFLPRVFELEAGLWRPEGEPAGRLLWGPAPVRGLAWGVAVGLVLLAAMPVYHHWIRPGFDTGTTTAPSDLARALTTPAGLARALLLTGLVTPLLEEFFYRVILVGFCLRQNLTPLFSVSLGALIFAAVHPPEVRPLLLVIGLGLGVLFWRCGPGSAVLAHSIYNAGVLLYTSFTGPSA